MTDETHPTPEVWLDPAAPVESIGATEPPPTDPGPDCAPKTQSAWYAYLYNGPGRYDQYPQAANGREVAAYSLGFLDGICAVLGRNDVSLTVECDEQHLAAITAAAFNADLVIRKPNNGTITQTPAVAVKISRA